MLVLVDPVVAQIESPIQQRLQKLTDSSVSQQTMPALAAAVMENQQRSGLATSGVRRVDQPANTVAETDRFHLGSCTKAMTATMIGILVQEGKLSWDDTIGDRLPSLASDIDKDYLEVTLWQLLTHHGGVQSDGAVWINGGVNTHENRTEIVKQSLAQHPPGLPIGEFQYSNIGYLAAALMAEQVTGESYEALMQEKLFEPLKMPSVGFGVPDKDATPRHPWGHAVNNRGLVPVAMDNPPSMAPAGAIHCTLDDWMKFAALHLDTTGQQHDLLTPETLKRLHQPYANQESGYAAGWLVGKRAGQTFLQHNGSNRFWFCQIQLVPHKGEAILVACNGPLKYTALEVDTVVQTIAGWLSPQP